LLNEQLKKSTVFFTESRQTVLDYSNYYYPSSVRLLIDAEQTYFQPMINNLVINLQRKFNRQLPVVIHTYQCYLTSSYQNISIDLERSRVEGFHFGGKLVRGAYMVQERALAAEQGRSSPIWSSKLETDANYHKCANLVLENLRNGAAMFAGHNQQSVEYVIQRMEEYVLLFGKGTVLFFFFTVLTKLPSFKIKYSSKLRSLFRAIIRHGRLRFIPSWSGN
jgi:hypothetical protein